MSRGQTTSEDATGGKNRPKSVDLQTTGDDEGVSRVSARPLSMPPAEVAEIDSAWDSPESSRAHALSDAPKVEPKPVVAAGKPATTGGAVAKEKRRSIERGKKTGPKGRVSKLTAESKSEPTPPKDTSDNLVATSSTSVAASPLGKATATLKHDEPRADSEVLSAPKGDEASNGPSIGIAIGPFSAEEPDVLSEDDLEWTEEFFAGNPDTIAYEEDVNEEEEMVDERRMRSLRPEACARRARYRVIVLVLIAGMILLIVAAALKLSHH
jgi:hypothetical protein